MNPNSSEDLNNLFWELIEEEFMDNTGEELLMSILQSEQQLESSTRHKRRRKVIDRSREEGNIWLVNDYFPENSVYIDAQFQRRFRMHMHVFLRIVTTIGHHHEYFQMRVDATGKMDISPLYKCIIVISMLHMGLLPTL